MIRILVVLIFSSIFFWQSCQKKPTEPPPAERIVVETQVKKSNSKTTIEFILGKPIYWGENGRFVERGTSPVELKTGTFEGQELIPFKIGETTKYKIETSEDINLEKSWQMLVADKNGEEFQGEIKLNQRAYLISVKEKQKR